MKAGAIGFAGGVVVGVLTTLWWLSDSGPEIDAGARAARSTPGSTEVVLADPTGLEPDATRAPVAPRSSVDAQRTSRPASARSTRLDTPEEPSTVEELIARLDALVDSGADDSRDYRAVFEALVALGTPQAIGVVLDAMEDVRLTFSWRGKSFFEVLRNVDDPRILPAAKRVLEQNVRDGVGDTSGYTHLVAVKGGIGAGEWIFGLADQSLYVRRDLAEVIRLVDDPRILEPVLELFESGDPRNLAFGRAMAESCIATYPNPGRDAIVTVAQREGIGPRFQRQLYTALAHHVPVEEAGAWCERYWTMESMDERTAFLGSLGYLGRSGKLDEAAKGELLLPLVEDALRSDSDDLWRQAVYCVEYQEGLHEPRAIAALEAFAASLSSAADREWVEQKLRTIRRAALTTR